MCLEGHISGVSTSASASVKSGMKFCCNNRYSWTCSRLSDSPEVDRNRRQHRHFRQQSQPKERRWKTASGLKPTSTTTTTTTTHVSSLSSVVLYPLAGLLAWLRASTLHFIVTAALLAIQQFNFNFKDASSERKFNDFIKLVAHFGSSMVRAVKQAWAIFLLASLLHQTVVVDGAKGGFRCDAGGNHLACLPKNYSKFELPVKQGINDIFVSIDIDEVLRINDKDYSITFSCYFNVKWPEKRLHLDPEFGREQTLPGVNHTDNPNIMVPMNLEFVKDLWLPNIFIYNLKTYKVIDVLNKLAGLWISATHVVLYSQATHITFICPMRFDKFPLDTQRCKFQVRKQLFVRTVALLLRVEISGDRIINSARHNFGTIGPQVSRTERCV